MEPLSSQRSSMEFSQRKCTCLKVLPHMKSIMFALVASKKEIDEREKDCSKLMNYHLACSIFAASLFVVLSVNCSLILGADPSASESASSVNKSSAPSRNSSTSNSSSEQQQPRGENEPAPPTQSPKDDDSTDETAPLHDQYGMEPPSGGREGVDAVATAARRWYLHVATKSDIEALRRARQIQASLDALSRSSVQSAVSLRIEISAGISRDLAKRNQVLRRVPGFWFLAMMALPKHALYIPQRPINGHLAAASSGGRGSGRVLSDQQVFAQFVSDIQCHRHGHIPAEAEPRRNLLFRSSAVTESRRSDAASSESIRISITFAETVRTVTWDAAPDGTLSIAEFTGDEVRSPFASFFAEIHRDVSPLLLHRGVGELLSDDPTGGQAYFGSGTEVDWGAVLDRSGIGIEKISILRMFSPERALSALTESERTIILSKSIAFLRDACSALHRSPIEFFELHRAEHAAKKRYRRLS